MQVLGHSSRQETPDNMMSALTPDTIMSANPGQHVCPTNIYKNIARLYKTHSLAVCGAWAVKSPKAQAIRRVDLYIPRRTKDEIYFE